MFSAIYIEEEIVDSDRVKEILERCPKVPQVICGRYGEVFNRNAQNFRLQKKNPALILAKKYGKYVLPTPVGYGYDDSASYYFSHMLNCVYDCRYCFLQGMYRSANYVLFVNYEDFANAIVTEIQTNDAKTVFYSGYDCDSMALEPISRFSQYFVELFSRHPDSAMEIRTKSTQIRNLLNREPVANCIIAMSFSSKDVAIKWESKVPCVEKRIDALRKLQQNGWPIALRFEPLIDYGDISRGYEELLQLMAESLDLSAIHSVSTGMFRMPESFFKKIVKLYPDEPLYATHFEKRQGMISSSLQKEGELLQKVEKVLFKYFSKDQYYRCE